MSRRRAGGVQRRELWAAVEAELGEAVVCARCRTTLKRFADTCPAGVDEPCEGFRLVGEVRARVLDRLRAAAGGGTDG